MRVLLLFLLLSPCACSTLNILADQEAYCREQEAGLVAWHTEQAATKEASQKPPNGWLTQPYSRENWNKYWNDVIFHVWKVDQTACSGTYEGPYGPEMVRAILDNRRQLGLPQVQLEERNRDKGL